MRCDASAYIGNWPFRNTGGTARGLLAVMRDLGLSQALVSPLAALFHTDPETANDKLLRSLKGRAGLWAVPVLNPQMATAGKQTERLAQHPRVRAVRLAPGFHGYSLESAKGIIEVAAGCGLPVIVQMRLQDERSLPPGFSVPPVRMDDLTALAKSLPTVRIIAAAAQMGDLVGAVDRIREHRNLWLDTSHLDGLACLARARETVGAAKMLFATCWPFFYPRSALLKVQEARLSSRETRMLLGMNAAELFGLAGNASRKPLRNGQSALKPL